MSTDPSDSTTPQPQTTPDPTEFDRKLAALRTDSYDVMAPPCPSRTVLRHLTDRWTPLIVANLEVGPLRFGQLREAIASIPPQVTYELTDLGHTLTTPILALRDWVNDHAGEVLAAREAYDAS